MRRKDNRGLSSARILTLLMKEEDWLSRIWLSRETKCTVVTVRSLLNKWRWTGWGGAGSITEAGPSPGMEVTQDWQKRLHKVPLKTVNMTVHHQATIIMGRTTMEGDLTTVGVRICTLSSLWNPSKNPWLLQSKDSRNLFKILEKSSDSSTKRILVTPTTSNQNNNNTKKMTNRSETSLLTSCLVGTQNLAIQNPTIRTVISKILTNNRTRDQSMEGTQNLTGKSPGSLTGRKVSQGPKRLSGIVDLGEDSLTLAAWMNREAYSFSEADGFSFVFYQFYYSENFFLGRLASYGIRWFQNYTLSRKVYEKYEKLTMRVNTFLLL